MATGTGIFGSSLAYLDNLAEQFETVGIKDEALFRLRALSRRMAEDDSAA